MVLCAIKKCDEKGLFSVNEELGIIAKTIDPPLLFCKTHLLEMCDLYSVYKGIESMHGFLCLFSDFWWTEIIQEEGTEGYGSLVDLRNAAELSLQLREEKLKDEIPKDGHQFYMEQMHESIMDLNDFLENRGTKWSIVRRRKLRRNYSKGVFSCRK